MVSISLGPKTNAIFTRLKGMAFSSASSLQPGDQVYLRYGGHSNAVLFTEYGFVLSPNSKDTHTLDGEITIDPDVEEMLRTCEDYEAKVQLLKDRNYLRWVASVLITWTLLTT
jgi:hypothetical protein